MTAQGVVVTMTWLGLTLCGCVITHESLSSSADRLERVSRTLAENARAEPPTADYVTAARSREARALAEQARDFRDTVEDHRDDNRVVRASFEELSLRYHDLRDEVDRSDSGRTQADLQPVTEAYLDVERAMGGYHDARRYAREGMTPDQY